MKAARKAVVLLFLPSVLLGADLSSKLDGLTVQIGSGLEVPYEDTRPGNMLSSFSDNVFGAWTHLTPAGTYESDLVSFQFSQDRTKLVLKTKPGVKFNNGRPITSADIEFSLLRGFYINPPFFAGFLKCVNGVHESLTNPGAGSVPGIVETDKHTIELQFTRPCPEIIHSLSLPFFSPHPQEEMAADRIHFKGLPVGAGPYKVVSEKSGEYQLQKVRGSGPDKITLLTKTSASPADVIAGSAVPEGYKWSTSTAANATLTLFTSNSHPLFKNPQIRSLFYQIFDRALLVKDESLSPATGLSLQTNLKNPTSSDVTRSRSILKQLIAEQYPQGLKIQIPVLMAAISPMNKRIVAELTVQLAEVGIDAEFFPRPAKYLEPGDATEYPFWLWWLVIDPLAPSVMLASFHPNSAYRFHQVPGNSILQLFEKVAAAKSDEERLEAERTLDSTISLQGFGIPLLRNRNSFAYNPKTVTSTGKQSNLLSIDLTQIKAEPCAASFAR